MILGTAASLFFIVFGFVTVAILLRVLVIVHHQVKRVKELETRLDTTDTFDIDQLATIQPNLKEE